MSAPSEVARAAVRIKFRKLGHVADDDEIRDVAAGALRRLIERDGRGAATNVVALRKVCDDAAHAHVRKLARRAELLAASEGRAAQRARSVPGEPAGYKRERVGGEGHEVLLRRPEAREPSSPYEPIESTDRDAVVALREWLERWDSWLSPPPNQLKQLPRDELRRLRDVHDRVFGYPPAEGYWYRGAITLASVVYAELTGFHGAGGQLEAWATHEHVTMIVGAAQLGRGGGATKKASIAKAVAVLVNELRRKQKLRALPTKTLSRLLAT